MSRCLPLYAVLLLTACPGNISSKLDRASIARDATAPTPDLPSADTLTLTTDAVLPDAGSTDLLPDVKSPVDLFPHTHASLPGIPCDSQSSSSEL